MPELCTNQEEADTRMLLHAEHASQNGHQRIAIKSSDTDVELLACYYQAVISADIILISGTSRRSRIVSIRRVCERLGREICEILPSLHAITGCDSVSAFSTKGKKKVLDVVQMNPALRQTLGNLGERVPARQDDLNKLERFVCALYNDHLCQSVNELRYKLFCKSKSLSPDGQGWQQKNGQLEIYWTNQAPAPQAVMELICCRCKGSCQTRRCSCVSNGLPCTEACTCQDNCLNCISKDDSEDDDSDDDTDGDEYES